MRPKLQRLTERFSDLRAKYGDVIEVHRIGRLYDHYSVFESAERVYEYAAAVGGYGGSGGAGLHAKEIPGESDTYFVLVFPESRSLPGKLSVLATGQCFGSGKVPGAALLEVLRRLETSGGYHLYSQEETIRLTRSRLGEHAYNLTLNNCEHFAL